MTEIESISLTINPDPNLPDGVVQFRVECQIKGKAHVYKNSFEGPVPVGDTLDRLFWFGSTWITNKANDPDELSKREKAGWVRIHPKV